jgi:hypothetical protein
MRRFVQPLLIGGTSAMLYGLAALMLLRIWRGPMSFFLGPWWIVKRLGGEPAAVKAAMTVVADRPIATFLLVTGVSWIVWTARIGAALVIVRRARSAV